MKNLLLVLLFVLPVALYSASPSCSAGSEISLIDANGKVVKTGKLDSRGELTLDGLEDVVYDIKLSNKGKSCMLNKPTEGSFSGLPTGKRQHKPVTFRMSSQKGSEKIFRPTTGTWVAAKLKTERDAASGLATGRRQHSKVADNDGVDQDCDDFEIQVTGLGNGKATFKEMTVTK